MYNEKTLAERIKLFCSFALVPMAAFCLVVMIPFAIGIFMTFTNWTGIEDSFRFMGIKNYIAAFTDPSFGGSMLFTVKYVITVLILTNVIAFGIALLVTSGLRGQNFFRAGFFIPNLIGGVVLGFVWNFIFSRVLVSAGKLLNIDAISTSWLASPEKAFWALVIVSVWQNSGYMMLVYIAGLMGIQKSILEAAILDGVNNFQRLIKIVIPLMVPSFTISIFLTLQRSFMVYDTNLSLTRGGPYRATELIAMHVYNEAFLTHHFGVGQAKALVLFVVVAVIALIQVGILKRMEVEA